MIKPLRKRHLQLWFLLAVLIPAGIVGALLVRPKPVSSTLLQPASSENLPVVIQKIEKENYSVILLGNDQIGVAASYVHRTGR